MRFNKLKEKWGIHSNFQLIVIFIVFALTGSSSVKLGRPVLDAMHITPDAFDPNFFGQSAYWILRLLVIFPLYQVLLLLFGALFFQFRFFWQFEKKMLIRMGLGFLFKKDSAN